MGVLEPSKRTFATRAMSTTEAALLTRGVSQLYLSLGDLNADGSMAIRLYHKPLVLLIWLGAVVMMLGGLLSLRTGGCALGLRNLERQSPRVPRFSRRSDAWPYCVSSLRPSRCLRRRRRTQCSPTKS